MSRAFIAAAALALAASAAAAQPATNRPGLAIVCVDVNGALRAPLCRQGLTTRIAPTEDSCVCTTGLRVEASVCPPDVAAPPDSLEVNRARNQVLRNQSTLVGATWQGRPLCVPPGLQRP
jgi:hypothetical protein